ncbi:MAG: Trk K+ transport system NAD-binding subunit [Halobacteriales archaeon]|jgi:Trk K+ transport system NAD-binding subunit
MERWQRRAIKTIGALIGSLVVLSVVYHYIMITFEGGSSSYFHSTQVVVETFTGSGFGSDSPWGSVVANAFVIALDLSTFLVLFIVLPYVFQPILESNLTPAPPRSVSLSDHVVVASEYAPRTERLVSEFETRGVEYVVVVSNEETALDLSEEGRSVIHGDPTSTDALDRACTGVASTVVIDVEDENAASSILAVREVNEDVRIIAQAQDPALDGPLKYAGADVVVTPRHLLAQRIADRVRSELDPRVSDIVTLGADFALLEVTVVEGDELCGSTLAESELAGRDDVRVIGLWDDGELVLSPSSETKIAENTTLIIAGPETTLRALEVRTTATDTTDGPVVIAGFGRVGSTVRSQLEAANVDCTVIDIDEDRPADVIGDATTETTLRSADVGSAASFVVALGNDDEAILAVVTARELAADLDVVARVNDADSASKLRRAGANYVLSLPDISGRLIALNVLRDTVLAYDRQVEIVRFDATDLPGETLADAPIRETDCFLVAVERDGDFLLDVSPQTVLESDVSVILAGDDEAIDSFRAAIK